MHADHFSVGMARLLLMVTQIPIVKSPRSEERGILIMDGGRAASFQRAKGKDAISTDHVSTTDLGGEEILGKIFRRR